LVPRVVDELSRRRRAACNPSSIVSTVSGLEVGDRAQVSSRRKRTAPFRVMTRLVAVGGCVGDDLTKAETPGQ
jgi:hypothetical protein